MSGAWKKVVKTAFKYTHFFRQIFRLRSHGLAAQPVEYVKQWEGECLFVTPKREQAI